MKKTDDLKLIKQLETELGIKLPPVPLEEIGRYGDIGYAADDNGRVRGLSILEHKMPRPSALLSKFQRLEKLALVDNQISDISSLKELTGLTELNLSENKISDISCLKELTGLRHLYLYKNKISDISNLKELTGLTKLYLNSNQISDISSLKVLTGLTHLYLGVNQITHLPAEFLDLGPAIKWGIAGEDEGIYLYGNPLESPPVEIIKKGNDAIRQYFKSLEGDQQALNEVKVLLVGDGAAGKTSLVKQLLGQTFDEKESQTDGININTMDITVKKTDIKAHLWDFGGQEIMHATHQFFLSKRSLYILVLDGRKDEKTEYWLHHIKSFGGDSPVLVVLNKIDQQPGFDVNRRFLLDKYPNIKGFYPLSCADGTGINELKKALAQQLTAVELLSTTWPKSWFNVKQHLEKMTDHFIGYDRCREICTGEKIDPQAMDTLVEFLNDLGVILHFKTLHLKDTHVLEPKWLTNAVYKIINSPQLSKGKGVLELDQMGEILKPKAGDDTGFDYPQDKHQYIFQLMKKFELCYLLDDQDEILVPDLLEVGEPAIAFDYASALQFRVQYNFLPRSVMPRFIVRRHPEIKKKLRWRTGVVLENNDFDAVAVVKSDEQAKTINIHLTGARRREYLTVLLTTLRIINKSFEKIEVNECAPLPDNPSIAVSYLHLLRLEQMNQTEFLPEGAARKYNVIELLDGIKPAKDRKNELEQLLRDGKAVAIIGPHSSREEVSEPQGPWRKILNKAPVIAAIIAALAAVFALLDSGTFNKIIKFLFG